MSLALEISKTKDEFLAALGRSASSGDASRSVQLARTLEILERDYHAATEIERRLEETRGQLSHPQAEAATSVIVSGESRKARGNRIRREFARIQRLRRVDGRIYETDSGKRVGIATATEDKRGDRWWLGIPNEDLDIVVLICENGSTQLEFVIPQSSLAGVWTHLSRDASGREIKFNVRRPSGTYGEFELLVTGDSPVTVTRFLANFEPLS